jgi:hypothetical protein
MQGVGCEVLIQEEHMVWGMMFGMLAGVVIGSATNNLGLWLPICLLVGTMIPVVFGKSRRNGQTPPANEVPEDMP